MTAAVALLRAVNVGGAGAVAMADLAGIFANCGLERPRTLLASGNVVFGAPDGLAGLADRLEREARARLGLDTVFILRDTPGWTAMVDALPFETFAAATPAALVAYALRDPPRAGGADALAAAHQGPEAFRLIGQTLYATYPAGIGRSRLTLALIERHLGTVATGRNWSTVRKIADALTAHRAAG